MSDLYKKMYATVAGEVDDTLQLIANALLADDCNRDKIIEIGEKLKKALSDAGEMYLDAEED